MKLQDSNRRGLWVRHPVPQALRVHFWIHWQAALLYLVKKLPFVPNTTVVGWKAIPTKDYSLMYIGLLLLALWYLCSLLF
jgi:hypothetical protein